MKVVSTTIRELYDHIATSSNTNQRGLVHTKIPRYVNTHYVLATVFQPYPLPYSLRKEVTSMLQLSYPRGGFKDSIPYRISLLYPPPSLFLPYSLSISINSSSASFLLPPSSFPSGSRNDATPDGRTRPVERYDRTSSCNWDDNRWRIWRSNFEMREGVS